MMWLICSWMMAWVLWCWHSDIILVRNHIKSIRLSFYRGNSFSDKTEKSIEKSREKWKMAVMLMKWGFVCILYDLDIWYIIISCKKSRILCYIFKVFIFLLYSFTNSMISHKKLSYLFFIIFPLISIIQGLNNEMLRQNKEQ